MKINLARPLETRPTICAILRRDRVGDHGMRVLLIDDDPRTTRAISRGLREESYVVEIVASGEEGASVAEENDYNLIVLDWYLPGKDGLAVCRDLRARGTTTPILMLTARDALADRVAALDAGADDYLTKPF